MSEVILDLEEFLERVQDDKELLLELLDIFSEDYQEKRKNLGEAVSNSDFEVIRSVSHSLKGASGNISAKAMREVCLDFEKMGQNNQLEGADDLLKALDEKFAELSVRMDELKKELAP